MNFKNDARFSKFNRDFSVNNVNYLKHLKKEDELKPAKEKLGETIIIPKDIAEIFREIDGDTQPTLKSTAAPAQYTDNDESWSCGIKIKDFIVETLQKLGVEFDDFLVNTIYSEIIKAALHEDAEVKLDLLFDIDNVTELISLIINGNSGISLDIDDMTAMQNSILNGHSSNSPVATLGEIREFIYHIVTETLYNQNTNPTNEPEVIDTPEKAMNALLDKIDTVDLDMDMTIKDFLLQLKAEASQYIQLQFGYEEQFADVIAMFLATAVSETSGVESGLIIDVELSAIKEKFLAFIQDMSFVDTSDSVSARLRINNGIKDFYVEGNIEDIFSFPSEDGYHIGDHIQGSVNHRTDNDLVYNEDGTPNNGVFLRFLVDYLKNEIYGGLLDQEQLTKVMDIVIKDFGKGYTWNWHSSGFYAAKLYEKRSELDKNKNSTFFDELLKAMFKVTETIVPINTNDLSSADTNAFFDNLFGTKNSLTASQIYSNENTYLMSNDAGTRAIVQALVDASKQYNIHNNVDYVDFVNVFIKMIYEKCGEEVKTDSKGNPILTKDILQKYFAMGNTLQDLKGLAEGKELRNTYYNECFLKTGGINGELDGNVYQGVGGDCWLLAELISLQATEAGRAIIRSAIHDNGDGTYTVTLLGGYDARYGRCSVNGVVYENYCTVSATQKVTTYTFTIDQIYDAMGTGDYAKMGTDPDIILLELAISKLREEQFFIADSCDPTGTAGDDFIYGGLEGELIFYLTGYGSPRTGRSSNSSYCVSVPYPGTEYKNSTRIEHTRTEFRDHILELIANGTIPSGTIGDNASYSITIGNHAYGVVGFTTEGIYYVNPYSGDSNHVLFMKWSDFVNGSDSIVYTPLIIQE